MQINSTNQLKWRERWRSCCDPCVKSRIHLLCLLIWFDFLLLHSRFQLFFQPPLVSSPFFSFLLMFSHRMNPLHEHDELNFCRSKLSEVVWLLLTNLFKPSINCNSGELGKVWAGKLENSSSLLNLWNMNTTSVFSCCFFQNSWCFVASD